MSKTRKKTEFTQYSKKMCTAVTIFWMLYRIINFVVIYFSADAAKFLAELCSGVDTVMIVNMGVYTSNSAVEKVAMAWVKRGQQQAENDDKDGENG